MTFNFAAYRRQWFTDGAAARRDIMAGLVVALALIPEAIGFSIIAGVDPRVGLYASVAIAMTIALIGGRPGMVSAATAAVAILVVPLVRDHGVDYLLAATILMGLIQIIAGLLRLDLVMQFVSRSVITGFVNAHIWDMSGVGALDKIVARLRRDGREVEVVGYNRASADIIDRLALHDKTGVEMGLAPH